MWIFYKCVTEISNQERLCNVQTRNTWVYKIGFLERVIDGSDYFVHQFTTDSAYKAGRMVCFLNGGEYITRSQFNDWANENND